MPSSSSPSTAPAAEPGASHAVSPALDGAQASATIAKPLVFGSSVPDASRVLFGMRVGFRYCYAKQLLSNPTEAGKILERIAVNGNGEIAKVELLPPTTLSEPLRSCIKERIEASQFEPPSHRKKAVVTAEVTFAASK